MSWIFYKRGTIKPYNIGFVFVPIIMTKNHPVGVPHPRTLYINEGTKLHWAWHEEEMLKLWHKFFAILRSPARLNRYLARVDTYLARAFKAADRVERLQLSALNRACRPARLKNIWLS